VTLLSFIFTLFAIIYLNYNEIQHPGSSVELVGTSITHALTIHSANSPSELRFLTGFDKQKTFGMRVDEEGGFEMFRAAEDLIDTIPAVRMTSEEGAFVVRDDLASMKMVSAPRLKSTSEGVIFPDGSVMTTAAETAIGVKSETDLNIIAGANQTVKAASIIMTVGDEERMRVRRDGVFFRDTSARGSGSTNLNEGISLYPDRKELNVGLLQLHSDGISTLDKENSISLHSAKLILNDTSSSPNGATLTAITAHHQASGQPFVIVGQDAILRGGDMKVRGGGGQAQGSRGGDLYVDGGMGAERHGDVYLGENTERLVLNCNKTEISASHSFTVDSTLTTVNSPLLLNNPITSFSQSAIKAGAGFSMMAVASAQNSTISMPSTKKTFRVVKGTFKDGFTVPSSGGYWAIAESCTTCVKFGAGGGYSNRHSIVSMLVEGIYILPTPTDNSGQPFVDCVAMKRVSISCAVLNWDTEVVEGIEVTGEGVEMVASTTFYGGDEYISLSASKLLQVKAGVEYGVFCRGTTMGGGDSAVQIFADKVTLSVSVVI